MADGNDVKSATKPTIFSPAETKIIMSMMQHMEGDFKFDADAVAIDCGLKSGSVVKQRWAQIRKAKITGASVRGIDKSSPNKKTATKPKSAAATKGKGGRKSKAAKAAEAAAEEDGDLDDCDDQDHEKLVKQEQLAKSDEED